ncbi:MAG: hypothetical protein SV760_08160, partial [Halobacteria archaeon]|nr:hypothetical protein [Halobacteria archaeon]
MSTIAIDIETASPKKKPTKQEHYRDTSHFELVAVGLGCRKGDNTETDVLFRQGGWEPEHTKKLLVRTYNWVRERDPTTVVTFNGE